MCMCLHILLVILEIWQQLGERMKAVSVPFCAVMCSDPKFALVFGDVLGSFPTDSAR